MHWNMRDSYLGFQAIEHRYRVLGGDPIVIHESNKVNLSRLFKFIYGDKYIGHPRMEKIIDFNQLNKKDFLTYDEEYQALRNNQYYKVHLSTLRKVYSIGSLAERANNHTLRTQAGVVDRYGSIVVAFGELIKENWFFAIIGFVLAVLGVISIF